MVEIHSGSDLRSKTSVYWRIDPRGLDLQVTERRVLSVDTNTPSLEYSADHQDHIKHEKHYTLVYQPQSTIWPYPVPLPGHVRKDLQPDLGHLFEVVVDGLVLAARSLEQEVGLSPLGLRDSV